MTRIGAGFSWMSGCWEWAARSRGRGSCCRHTTPSSRRPLRGYDELDGISDGGMAMEAYVEAIDPGTPAERKGEIERELKVYCALDTEAMLRVWEVFGGAEDLK